jgi:hypothetical protein
MRRPILVAAALVAVFAPVAGAEEPAAPPKKLTDVTTGFGFHAQTRWTGSLTVMHGRPTMLVAFAPGKLAQARLGAGGVQGSLGLVFGVFEESLWKPSGIAVTLKATAVRTFDGARGAPRGITFAGLESDVVILGIRGSVGYLRRVGGAPGPAGRFLWSVGLGL